MNRYTIILKTMLGALMVLAGTGAAMADGEPTLSAAYKQETARTLMEDMDNTDADSDGMVSRAEFTKHQERFSTLIFERMDANDDGMLDHDEMMASMPEDEAE